MSKNIKNRKMRLLNNMLWYRLFFHISFIYLLCEVGLDVLRIEIHVGRYMFCRKKSVGFPPNRITKKKCCFFFFNSSCALHAILEAFLFVARQHYESFNIPNTYKIYLYICSLLLDGSLGSFLGSSPINCPTDTRTTSHFSP